MSSEAYHQALVRTAQVVEVLRSVCCQAAKDMDNTQSNRAAFTRDAAFLDKMLESLRVGAVDEIESIWQNVQHLSRFFGGDYIRSSGVQNQFEVCCQQLFEATLELIQIIRSTPR